MTINVDLGREVEVKVTFDMGSMSKGQLAALIEAEKNLGKAGIYFDRGSIPGDKRDWQLDWSLNGPVSVTFKRFSGTRYPLGMSMNIYAKTGHEVIVTKETLKNGLEEDIEKVKRLLSKSRIYTIERTEVGGSRTRVFLKEFPGIPFNSVNFEDVEKSIPPLTD